MLNLLILFKLKKPLLQQFVSPASTGIKNFSIFPPLLKRKRIKKGVSLNQIQDIDTQDNPALNQIQNISTLELEKTQIKPTPTKKSQSKPTPTKMAEILKENLSNYKFDVSTRSWFIYNQELGAWTRIDQFTSEQNFYLMLRENFPSETISTNLNIEIKKILEFEMGIDFKINQVSRLVPFKNGVLDINNINLLKHDSKYYFTYCLNINYDAQAKIKPGIIEFLKNISNNNAYTLKILRSFIQCLLLRDNQYQVALYIYGPGGTGKSTFERVLSCLVGAKGTAVVNLIDLNKTFTTSKLVDKSLVLFSDVGHYTGDPSKLRLLISGDIMAAEKKYSDSFDFQPTCLVVLSSNVIWNPNDPSTGLQRRIIYIPMTTSPKTVDRHLFSYNLRTNEITGTLTESLAGLVNWALENPVNNLSLLNNAVEINKLIDPSAMSSSNPLVDWIQIRLKYSPGALIEIGLKTSEPDEILYPNYLLYCKENGYTKTLPLRKFSIILVQQLNSLIDNSIEKIRTKHGFRITNIIINLDVDNHPEVNSAAPLSNPTPNIYDEFNGFVENTSPNNTLPLNTPSSLSSAIPALEVTTPTTSVEVNLEPSSSSSIHESDPAKNRTRDEILDNYEFNEFVIEKEKVKKIRELNSDGVNTEEKLKKQIDLNYDLLELYEFNFSDEYLSMEKFFPLYYDYCDNLPETRWWFAHKVADFYVELLCCKKLLNESSTPSSSSFHP